MPELPEVETVVRTLEKQIGNATISDVHVLHVPIVKGDIGRFVETLKGHTIRSYKRRGKYLLFELDNVCLVAHLRMEGKFFIYSEETNPSKHDHLIISLNDGREVHYNDVRKFGRFEICPLPVDYKSFKDLGPEPLEDSFNVNYCESELRLRTKCIKSTLLDQVFVAGIGNIYADEILFRSRIHPLIPCFLLSKKEIRRLTKNTKLILSEAIKAGGSTIRSYTSSLGVTGLFQNSLSVYGRKGELCPRCSSKIKKIEVGGRGTHFCPNCQKNKRRIAITGLIGSGKSAVSQIIRENNYSVFDADAVNSELLKNDVVLARICDRFPEAFENGMLIRSKLASLIFNDQKNRKDLENILHPIIRARMISDSKKVNPFFAEIPLLFESNFDRHFDYVMCVVASEENILKRMANRGYDRNATMERLKTQYPVSLKVRKSDLIINNDKSYETLESEVERWLKKIDAWQK